MKTMSLLFCHNGHHFAPPHLEGCAFNHPMVISCLIWAIVVIILGILAYCYLKNRNQIKKNMADALHQHELDMKEKLFGQEKHWHDENKKAKEEELTRKIREYNELTKVIKNEDLERKIREYNELTKVINNEDLERKIQEYNELTKVINNEDLERKIQEYNELTIHQKVLGKVTGSDEEIETLKKNLEDLKKKYESLDGEIEQIIIKKKQ